MLDFKVLDKRLILLFFLFEKTIEKTFGSTARERSSLETTSKVMQNIIHILYKQNKAYIILIIK
jgi:hypothetical protein